MAVHQVLLELRRELSFYKDQYSKSLHSLESETTLYYEGMIEATQLSISKIQKYCGCKS